MNKKLLVLASTGLLLVGPVAQLPSVTVDTDHPMSDQTMAMPARSDEEITRDVKDVFAKDKDLAFFVLTVDTSRGVVTIGGVVDNAKAKAAIAAKAKAIAGVRDVNDKVEVKPSMEMQK